VSLKPGDEIPDVSEYLVMEVESSALDFDEFLDWLFVLVHVNQEEVLGILRMATEIVVD
jgi:hypothetical protein